MKAYKAEDGSVRLFRPDMNMKRMNRVSLAVPFSAQQANLNLT